ncbi:MAG: hypothetical protein ACC613_11580 [Synergistales bacterium]|jgi:hypothetical protein
MAMPMQINLDELLSMVLARVDSLSFSDENQKTKFNILARVLYRKGLLTDEDVLESVREEHRVLKELGLIPELPSEEALKTMADSVLLWIKGDVPTIRKSMEEYDRKMREMAVQEAQAQKSRIEVAPSSVLQQIDRMSGKKPGGKLIV